MATTTSRNVGKTRILLANLLEQAIPTAAFEPENLTSQTGSYAHRTWDLCRWSGDGNDKETGLPVHVASWDTMRDCVRYGITAVPDRDNRFWYEVFRNGH